MTNKKEETKQCEGDCLQLYGHHTQNVVSVIVEFEGVEWDFNYCENAIQEDRDRGFTVTIVEENN